MLAQALAWASARALEPVVEREWAQGSEAVAAALGQVSEDERGALLAPGPQQRVRFLQRERLTEQSICESCVHLKLIEQESAPPYRIPTNSKKALVRRSVSIGHRSTDDVTESGFR